jgi:hypothetical protein
LKKSKFLVKNVIRRAFKLQEKPPASRQEHPALNTKFLLNRKSVKKEPTCFEKLDVLSGGLEAFLGA